jgi:exopolysaccharide biosynthesis WecB/TagA/CpsF family protein
MGERVVVCTIDNLDLAGFCAVAAGFGVHRYGYVVTPNVDHLVRYYQEPAFRNLYHSADFVVLDSRVVALVLRILKGAQLAVCPGSDLTAELLRRVASSSDRIVVVGGTQLQAEQIATGCGLPDLRHHEPPMGFISDAQATDACLNFIEAQSPFRFCFLAVGSPQQEILAQRLQRRGNARGLALCVGASLNMLTGSEKRAPRWMQRAALEWLYRLSQDPRRLARRYLLRGPRLFPYLLDGRLMVKPKQRT